MTRVTLVGPNTENKLQGALDTVMETTQDFTDSAYTSHENRERILLVSDRLRQELQLLLQIGVSLVSTLLDVNFSMSDLNAHRLNWYLFMLITSCSEMSIKYKDLENIIMMVN